MNITDDNLVEGQEEVVLDVSSADVALSRSTITLRIADKDIEGTIHIVEDKEVIVCILC